MPKQSPLKIIKRCRLQIDKNKIAEEDVKLTRGLYVLYEKVEKNYTIKYIGVGGISKDAKSGIFARLKNHEKTKKAWTHYSVFEVHDNISNNEIKELESLFLAIFRHSKKIEILNKQKGSKIFNSLAKKEQWEELKE